MKLGDKILVRDSESEEWQEAIFLLKLEGSKYPYVTDSSRDGTVCYRFKCAKTINSKLQDLRDQYEKLGEQIKKLEDNDNS